MKRSLAILLAFALPAALGACDAEDDMGDDGAIETADGQDTDGEDEIEEEDAEGDTAADDNGGTTGDDNAAVMEPQLDPCEEYGTAQACPSGGTRYCDDFDGELAWGECVSKAVCVFGETRACGLSDDDVAMGCTLEAGVPMWDEDGCG